MIILGAGLAGLLAGTQFQTATLLEQQPESTVTHKAVLRFRSAAVGEAVGVDFKQVTVRKGIWAGGQFRAPTIQLANWYAMKVTGKLLDRSIWNLESVDRFIAPEDFIYQLYDRCRGRIEWNTTVTSLPPGPVISTLPMSVMATLVPDPQAPPFRYERIIVHRWRLADAAIYQTVYFPEPDTTLYRVSITGDLVIAEYIGQKDAFDFWPAFGLADVPVQIIDATQQRFGKITPIDDRWRKGYMFRLTAQHQVYSLGRFATWRNILLDDVLHDLTVIKRLLQSGLYDHARVTHE